MAGHSQFKNIMHRKGAQDKKKAKLFTKIIREITVSSRTGLPDPNLNPRLRSAIIAARAINMPKDKIEGAIKKGQGPAEGEHYEEIRYEGYAPGGVAVIVEALSDNRNRTASDVRAAFTKYGGSLAETGSVSFMFERVGVIEYLAGKATPDQMLEAAIEAGANECESDNDCHILLCDPDSLHSVRDALSQKFGDPESAKLSWKALNTIELDQEKLDKITKLIEALEDNDDVQNVYTNMV